MLCKTPCTGTRTLHPWAPRFYPMLGWRLWKNFTKAPSTFPNSNSLVYPTFQRAEIGRLDPLWLDLAFLGTPRFSRGPKTLQTNYFGTSGQKSGRPQKRQIQPRWIQLLILGPLTPQKHPKLRPWSELSLPRNLDHGLSFSLPSKCRV